MTDLILGKYNNLSYLGDVEPTVDPAARSSVTGFKLDKYEFWFTSTINCIPYNGSSVFVIDSSGNTRNAGNLLVQQNLTINGNTAVDGNLGVKQNLSVGQNVDVGQIVRVGGDLYVGGNIFSAQISAIQSQIAALQSQINSMK